MANIYRRLPNGDWGVQCDGIQHSSGDVVTVTKRDGGTKVEVLDRHVGSYGACQIWSIGRRARNRAGGNEPAVVWFNDDSMAAYHSTPTEEPSPPRRNGGASAIQRFAQRR